MAAICGFCSAIVIGTLFGYVALFPSNYTTAVMSGNGVAGIIIFVLKSLLKVSFGPDPPGPRYTSIVYFSIATFVLIACFIIVITMKKIEFVQFYIQKETKEKLNSETLLEEKPLIVDQSYKTPFFYIMKKIWPQALNVFWIFFVTLSLFPGLLFRIQPSWSFLSNGWIGIILVGIFQIGDFIGRTLPQFLSKQVKDKTVVVIPPKYLFIPAFSHSIFFLLIILLIVPMGHPTFSNNAIAFVIIMFFSISNGFFGTLAMIYGPQNVNEKDTGRVGTIMAVFLNFGIFVGSHMAFLILWLVDPTSFDSIF